MSRLAWKQKVDIKQHFTEDESAEALTESSEKIAKELERYAKYDDELEDALYCMVSAAKDGDLEEVNYNLERVYDWGDDNRVWLGL